MYLTPDQFRVALEKGLGRAVLHIREHGAEGLRDHLLHACLHNVAHDTQLEGDRSGWLLSMIDITGEEAFYRERILEKIEVIDEVQEADRKQLLCFAREFAKRGHEKFRQSIYRIFDSQKYDDYNGDKEIVELDGVKGLLHVADINGLKLRIDPGCYWENGYLLNYAIKELGFSEAIGDLKKHSKNNTNIQAYMKAINASNKKMNKLRKTKFSLKTILEMADNASGSPGDYVGWGRTASDKDINSVFDNFLKEIRPKQILCYLKIFHMRGFPRIEPQLFDLVEFGEDRVRHIATWALFRLKDHKIHEFALNLLRNGVLYCSFAIKLLEKNYQSGDFVLIQNALPVTDDKDEIHRIGSALVDLCQENNDPDLSELMLWVYEKTSCSICREQSVEKLLQWNSMPMDGVWECLFDCSEKIRVMANTQFVAG